MKKFLLILGLIGAGKVMGQAVGFDSAAILGGPLREVSGQFAFTEGAAVDRKGNIFFTDQPNNKIWEYTLDGRLVLFLDSAGRSNGMYFDRKGRLITCADENDQLWAIDMHKKIQVLLKDLGGHRLNGPNDLWIDGQGGIYFTDPYYQRESGWREGILRSAGGAGCRCGGRQHEEA